MVTKREFSYPSSDKIHQIHATEWRPESAPRAVLQLVHGISEHMGRYDDFARFLAGHGFVVVGSDHLGHGRTAKGPEEYGYLANHGGWQHLVTDIHALRVLAGEEFLGLPYFILGHSMGSFLTRTYLIDWPDNVAGALLSGTGQEPALMVAFGKALAGLFCLFGGGHRVSGLITALSLTAYNNQFKPTRTPSDWTSRDTAMVDAYVADPLCRFVPTVGMFRDMMGGLQYIARPSNLRQMDTTTPIYFFSGDRDPVGASGKGVTKVANWFRAVGCTNVSVKLYPDGRHEMLNELNRAQVYQDTLAWLETQLPQ